MAYEASRRAFKTESPFPSAFRRAAAQDEKLQNLREKLADLDSEIDGLDIERDEGYIDDGTLLIRKISLQAQKGALSLIQPVTTFRHLTRKETEKLLARALKERQPIMEKRIANGEIPSHRVDKLRTGVTRDIARYKQKLGLFN